jgi:hypothetical protein
MRVFLLGVVLFAVAAQATDAAQVRLGCPVRLTHCVNYRSTVCSDFNPTSYVGFRLDAAAHSAYMPTRYYMRETAIEFLWGTIDDRYALSKTTMRIRHSVYVNQSNVAFVAEWSGVCRAI